MKVYTAKVVDDEGKERNIVENAISRELFESNLNEKGLYIIKITEGSHYNFFIANRTASGKFIADFCHNIYSLLDFGIDINEVFRILKGIYTKGYEANLVRDINNCLNKGEKLSDIIKKSYSRDFNNFIITMISAGESSGRLKESFKLINQYLNTTKKIKEKIQSASLYPIILLTVTFLVLNLILFVTVPNFGKIYTDMDFTPPTLVGIMINISTFLNEIVIFYIASIIIIILTSLFFIVSKSTRNIKETILSRIPIISKVVLLQEKIKITFGIEILLKGGFSIENALKKVTDFENSAKLKKEFFYAEEVLSHGGSIKDAFKNIKSFNHRDINILGISDSISNSLAGFEKIRIDSENDLEIFLEKIFKMIEPAIMLVIGVFIFFVMYLVISPTLGMLEKF